MKSSNKGVYKLQHNIKIVVDSNHIYKLSSNRLIRMIDNYSELGTVYIPEVVIDELIQRDIDYVEKVNIYRNDSVIINNIIKTMELQEQLINDIRLYYSKIFNNNVIKISSIQINEMYNRSLIKKPPFIEDKNASDKGFKDSLIWLSILEDNHSTYDEIIFLSSDNSFIDNKDTLKEEFMNKHSIEISFLRKLEKNTGGSKTTTNHVKSEDDYLKTINDFKKLESIREELDRALDKIINLKIYNDFGDYYNEQRFVLYEELEILPLEKLIENLNNLMKENIMRNSVLPNEFLNVFGYELLFNEKQHIETKDINSLYDLLYRASYDLDEYSESIVKALIEYINVNTFQSLENPF